MSRELFLILLITLIKVCTRMIRPMISMIANDNWVEFTLRYVVNYKRRRATKTELFTQILSDIEATNGEIKFASATFQLVEPPEFKIKMNK